MINMVLMFDSWIFFTYLSCQNNFEYIYQYDQFVNDKFDGKLKKLKLKIKVYKELEVNN